MQKKQRLFFFKISFIVISILIFVQIAVAGFLLAKADYLKAQAIAQLSELTQKKVTIDKFEFIITTSGINFLSSQVKLGKDISIKKIEVELNIFYSLLTQELNASKVTIDNLVLKLSKQEQSSRFDIREFLSFDHLHLSNTQIIADKKYFLNAIDITDEDNIFIVKTKQQILPLPEIFSKSIPKMDMILKFDTYKNKIQGKVENKDIKLDFKLSLMTSITKSINLEANIQRLNLEKVKDYLPNKVMDKTLVTWLSKAFQKGQTKNAKVTFIAPPKKTWKESLDKASLKANIPLLETQLFFNEGWQSIKQMNGVVTIDDSNLIIKADAKLAKLNLKKAWINIPDLFTEFPVVVVSGTFKIPSEDGIDFLHSDKVIEEEVGQYIRGINLYGKTTTSINLTIPIASNDESPVDTDIDIIFENNTMTIKNVALKFNQVKGRLFIKGSDLTAQGKAVANNYPVSWTLNETNKIPLTINVEAAPTATVKLVNDGGFWRVDIKHPDVVGNMFVNNNFIDVPWRINIDFLNVDAFINNITTNTSTINLEITDIFPSIVNIKSFIYQGKDIAQLKLTIEKPTQTIVIFSGILSDEKIGLSFSGSLKKEHSEINFDLNTDKVKNIFDKLSIPLKHENGKTIIIANLNCECPVFKMRLNKVKGNAKVIIKKGRFLGQGNFAGSVLSLLNFRALGKRLSFDGSGIDADDFEYDLIQAKLNLKNGQIMSEKTEVFSSSSYIRLTGKTDLIKQEYEFDARVNPHISGAIPIISYLTGGGLLGLGLWAFDEIFFSGQMLNDGVSAFYTIRGPWDKPIIK
jgi:uncharacterized protein YhdP